MFRFNIIFIKYETWVRRLSLMLVLLIILLTFAFKDNLPDIDTIGYLGVFVLSLVGSASILVPIPGTAAICVGPGLLDLLPFAVAFIGSVAEVIGETSSYIIGYGSRGLAEPNRFYKRIEFWMQRKGSLFIFLMCCIPNPLFDIVGIAAGTLKFPIRRFLISVWVGKLVKGLLISYSCFYGFDLAIEFFVSGE